MFIQAPVLYIICLIYPIAHSEVLTRFTTGTAIRSVDLEVRVAYLTKEQVERQIA